MWRFIAARLPRTIHSLTDSQLNKKWRNDRTRLKDQILLKSLLFCVYRLLIRRNGWMDDIMMPDGTLEKESAWVSFGDQKSVVLMAFHVRH